MSKLYYALPLLLLLALSACSSSNSDAPVDGIFHPVDWQKDHQNFAATQSWTACIECHGLTLQGGAYIGKEVPGCFAAACHAGGPPAPHDLPFTAPSLHGPTAKASQLYCRNCHGRPLSDFDGGFVADPQILNRPLGACTVCHPGAKAHPTSWQGTNEDIDPSYHSSHRGISQATMTTSCALCHKTDGPGSGPLPPAPSCFSASYTNSDGNTTGCHADGPGTSPHSLPFTDPATHGPEAKSDLSYCQTCHGSPGTTSFAGGFTGVACSSCHPAAGAHPTRWQGSNDNTASYLSSHRTAGSLATACAICHNTEADAPGPHLNAPSCFTAGFTNADGVTTSCHAGGPGAPHAIPFVDPALHGPEAKTDLNYCQTCHGVPGSPDFDGGSSGLACSSCHLAADAHPTRWQGSNDDTPDYLSSHRSASNQSVACAICHDFTEGRTAPNPAAPSCFSASFTNADGVLSACHAAGPGAPHPLPFTNPALHGAEAKQDFTYCRNCHATPADAGPGGNPRFNVAIGRLTTGCEDCHNDFTAHPVPWLGAGSNSHKTAGNLTTSCALCHGATLGGSVGPACTTCHQAGLPTVLAGCTSCHNTPPDSAAPAGNSRPNREGAHSEHNALAKVTGVCGSCHNGAGTNTINHFDTTEPATVAFLPAYNAKSGAATFSSADRTCSNVSCHGGQTTPAWLTGSLNVNTQCTSCHRSGTTQYNSYFSGDHTYHLTRNYSGRPIICLDCHNVTTLATNHFTNLDTQLMEGPASATIGGSGTLIPATGYNVISRSCTPTCHPGDTETW